MRVLINRERKGKKQVPAPKSIEVYDVDGDLVSTIIFDDEGCIILKNHNGKKIETILKMSDDGLKPQIFSSHHTTWATVGKLWTTR